MRESIFLDHTQYRIPIKELAERYGTNEVRIKSLLAQVQRRVEGKHIKELEG